VIDGADAGPLPLDAPVALADGWHTVTAELPGMLPMRRKFVAEGAHQTIRLHLRLMPMSRKFAALQSLMLAGSGQRYVGRPTLGWILTGVEVGGLLTALVADMNAQNRKDEYLLALDAYGAAFLPDDLAYYRTRAEDKHAGMRSALDLRNAALAAAAGAVAVSVLDAWLRFPSAEMGPGPRPAPPPDRISLDAPRRTACGDGFHVGWRLSF
ncbi:hypothetical protein KKA85_10240, partial [bacterium]|nr:hypothetical protein [bacterium]MBU1676145.1 hypothetical protein [bacterium]